MKIDVETISDECRNCPELEIDVINLYTDSEIYYRQYRCVNLDTCRQAVSRSTVKQEGHNE